MEDEGLENEGKDALPDALSDPLALALSELDKLGSLHVIVNKVRVRWGARTHT